MEIGLRLFAALSIIVVTGLLVIKYFRQELVDILVRMDQPSAKALRRQSEELLEQMNRNVAARKARKT